MSNRLSRSRSDKMIGGVCGGLAQYLRIDSTIIRLLFVVLALGTGVGVLLYLIMWIIVPYEGEGEVAAPGTIRSGADEMADRMRTIGADLQQAVRDPNPKTGLIIGGALVLLGIVFLARNLDVSWLRWLRFEVVGPVLLILIGVALVWRRLRGGSG